MLKGIKAVIFDMDGVIIDSEPLWRRAMIKGFNDIGFEFTNEHCRLTTGIRFKEVIEFWFNTFNYTKTSVIDFDKLVVDNFCELIKTEGKPVLGINELLNYLKHNGFKIGLATSSNINLMNCVVNTLNIRCYFDSLCSAQFLEFGKPHPQVFIECAKELKINHKQCLIIEDSLNGIIAGKAAQMKVVAIPEFEHFNNPKFEIADCKIKVLKELMI